MADGRVLIVGEGPVAEAIGRAWRDGGGTASNALAPTTDDGWDRLVADAATGSAGFDTVVHIMAPSERMAFQERGSGSWSADLDTAIGGPIRLASVVARTLGRRGGGSITFVGPMDAFHAYPGRSVASIAMGALLGLVRSLAVELAPLGVRANAVVRGPMADDDDGSVAGAEPPLLARTLLRSPAGRLVTPAEVAAAVRFVAGPRAGFMTGQTLRVDGGWASLNQAPDGMRFP